VVLFWLACRASGAAKALGLKAFLKVELSGLALVVVEGAVEEVEVTGVGVAGNMG
jgi:hypothetical protein